MSFRGNTALSTIGKLYKIFNTGQKKQFNWLIFLTFVSSISDLVGLYFIIPVVGLVLSPTYYNSVIHFAPFLGHFAKNELLLIFVGIFFIIIIAKNAFGLYINRLQVTFVQNLFVTSSMNVLNKVYDRSVLEIQKTTSNELVNKLTSLQMTLCSYATIPAIILINESIIFVLTTIVVCAVNWHLFLLMACVVFPIMGFFYSRVKNMIKTAGSEKNSKGIEIYAKGQEMVFGYMDIKIAGTETSFKKRFESLAKKYSVAQGKMDFMLFIPTRIIEIAIFLCICIILIYGVFVIKDINQIVATISAFSMLAYRSIPSINRFIMAMNNLNAADFIFKDPDFYLDETKQTERPPVAP
ncbi:MAG: ABC transporter transmembrane domain-containing protein, partial [Mucilaginibacter sp.]